MSTATVRSEFVNVSGGVIGVVVLDGDGKRKGIPVKPNDSVWLTEEEEILTANAPRNDSDNPFAQGWLQLKTRASDVINRRPIGSRGRQAPTPVAPSEPEVEDGNSAPPPRVERPGEEVGAAPAPEGEAATGVRAPGEEVATPQVVPSGKRPAPTRGQTVRSDNPAAKPADPEAGAKPRAVAVGQGGARYVEPPGE